MTKFILEQAGVLCIEVISNGVVVRDGEENNYYNSLEEALENYASSSIFYVLRNVDDGFEIDVFKEVKEWRITYNIT